MKQTNTFVVILSVIAIILSIIAIILVFKINSSNYITKTELYDELASLPTTLQNSDFSKFQTELNEYNTCVRQAISSYSTCDQTCDSVSCLDCDPNLDSQLQSCQSNYLYKP